MVIGVSVQVAIKKVLQDKRFKVNARPLACLRSYLVHYGRSLISFLAMA